jgi:transcriptional antiterminator
MDNKQFTQLVRELETLKKLLILNTLRSGANQGEVAKLLGLSDRQIRNILAGK